MKWLIKEGAIQFESSQELMIAIKILYELFDLAKEVKDKSDAQRVDLADSLPQPQGTSQPQAANAQQPAAETQQAPVQKQAADVQQPAAETQQTPVQDQAAPETVSPVPTAPHTYSIEDLQNAARGLLQAGKQEDLQALLGEFNTAKISLLADDQLGAFATRLREMGGNI